MSLYIRVIINEFVPQHRETGAAFIASYNFIQFINLILGLLFSSRAITNIYPRLRSDYLLAIFILLLYLINTIITTN